MSVHTGTPGALWKNALELMDRKKTRKKRVNSEREEKPAPWMQEMVY